MAPCLKGQIDFELVLIPIDCEDTETDCPSIRSLGQTNGAADSISQSAIASIEAILSISRVREPLQLIYLQPMRVYLRALMHSLASTSDMIDKRVNRDRCGRDRLENGGKLSKYRRQLQLMRYPDQDSALKPERRP
jgi:hypothetical protein